MADPAVIVEVDRPILAAALSNLLHNAFKFTRRGSTVKLRATVSPSRVLLEVEDECGGLPTGGAETMLLPFVQVGRDRSGVGLGLASCMKAATSLGGELHVRDVPGHGCIFTIDLPRQPPPPTPIHAREAKPKGGQLAAGAMNARTT